MLCRQYDAQQALEMGLVNTVVPLERARGGDGAVVPRDARPLPLRPAPGKGELSRRGGRHGRDPAARARRQPPVLRQRRGEGGPRGLQGQAHSPTSRSSRSDLESSPHLADGRAAADAAGGGRAGARRHGLRGDARDVPAADLHRDAARRAADPDRHEPLQRLQRRPPRRRHRGPARPGARDRRRPRPAQAGADRDLRRVRAGGAGRRLPDRHRRLAAAAGRHRLDPRRRALHGRAAPVRLRRARRGLRLPLLRRRRRDRHVLRPARGAQLGVVRAGGAGRPAGDRDPDGQQRPRPGDRPAGGQEDARRAARARPRRGSATRCWSTSRSRPRRWPGCSAAST